MNNRLTEKGERAARDLIDRGDRDEILRNYGFSCAAPDQTYFDVGYQRVIRAWLRNQQVAA